MRSAVLEYAYACAEEEFERASYVAISGGVKWAYEYMPAFFGCLADETFGPFAGVSFLRD